MRQGNRGGESVESVFASILHTAVELAKVVGISLVVAAAALGLAGGAFYAVRLMLSREWAAVIAMSTAILEIGAAALFVKRRYEVHQRSGDGSD